MLPSDITKMAQSFSDIAEGKDKDKDDSYLETDMKKRRKNNEKAVEDMKKVKDDTVPRWMRENIARESFYYKRLEVFNKVMAEKYLAIAGFLVSEGYESPRLIDNIIEIMPKDVVGHDFRAAIFAVNPRLNENFENAEKKQARAIIREMDLGKKWKEFTNWLAPPKGTPAAADPKVRAGMEYTGPGGTAVRPNNSRASREAAAAATSATPASTPARPQRGQGGRALGSTTQRQGGAVNPTTANAPAPAPKPAPSAPAKPAPTAATKPFVKQTGNKAADMATWAKANPKLAAAKAERDRTRGTSATTNPMMQDMKSRLPAPKTAAPSVVKSGYEYVRSKLIEGIRDKDPEKGTEERKERLEKKRGMKLDDHPQYKKEEVEQVDESGYFPTPESQRKDYEKHKPNLSTGELPGRHKPVKRKPDGSLQKNSFVPEGEMVEMSLYDIVVSYLQEEKLAIDEEHAALVIPELSAEEVAYIVDEYTTKHGKKAMDWNRSDDKPKTVAKNPKMPKKKEGKCSCCGNDPCTCS